MTDLAQWWWFGHVAQMRDERYPTKPWQARTKRKRPKGRARQNRKEGIKKIYEESRIEWNGVSVSVRDRERWEVLCKPSTSNGIRRATVWNDVKWSEVVAGQLARCWRRGWRGELAGRAALRTHYKAFSPVSETAAVIDALKLLPTGKWVWKRCNTACLAATTPCRSQLLTVLGSSASK